MKKQTHKICLLLLAGLLSAAPLTGCSSKEAPATEPEAISSETTKPENIEETKADGKDNPDQSTGKDNLGQFTTQDIQGETYTEEMFQDYDLTLVNIFTTWCTPCINEIPDLQKLKDEMSDRRVNVVGIVLDAIDESGNTDQEAVEKAKLLAEKTGVSYTFLLPDETNLNGRLDYIYSVPETFFADKDGNIIGEAYVGSRSLEEWEDVVETQLAALEGAEE